jgi:hypothetical protein
MNVLICAGVRADEDQRPANVGDLALTDALAYGVKQRWPEAQVRSTLTGGGTVSADHIDRWIAVTTPSSLLKALRWSNMVLLGGGTMFQQDVPTGLLPSGVTRYVLAVTAGVLVTRRPMWVVGMGAERMSIWSRAASSLARRVARGVYARDFYSQVLLGPGSRLGADPIVLGDIEVVAAPEGLPRTHICLTRDASEVTIEQVGRALGGHPGEVILVRMDQRPQTDEWALAALRRRRAEIRSPAPVGGHWRPTAERIQAGDLVISMRLHLLWMGALRGARLIAIDSSPKLRSFAAEMGIPLWDGRSPLELEAASAVDADRLSVARTRAAQMLDSLETS